MKQYSHPVWMAWAVVLILLASSQPLYAYVDPSTGSILLQILLGGLAGILLLGKVYWRRLKHRFGFREKTSASLDSQEERELPGK